MLGVSGGGVVKPLVEADAVPAAIKKRNDTILHEAIGFQLLHELDLWSRI